jgi:hypothetical protein
VPTRSDAPWSPVRRAAFLAAAATLGVLAGFGMREGLPLVVLGGAGLRLRGLPEFVTPDRGVGPTALLGAAHTGLLAYAWGSLAALLAWRLGGWRGAAAAALVAAGIHLLDPRLPALLRLGAGAPSPGQRLLCVAALAAAAALGTRLAAPTTVAPAPRGDARALCVDDAPRPDEGMPRDVAHDGTVRGDAVRGDAVRGDVATGDAAHDARPGDAAHGDATRDV